MKDILVSVDSQQDSEPLLQYASALSDHLNARLTCLYVERTIDYALYGESFGTYLAEALQSQLDEELSSIKEIYDRVKDDGVNPCRFIHERSIDPQSIQRNLLVSDLIITKQHNSDFGSFHYLNRPEDFIMKSGRPVIVIPFIGAENAVANHILVAWNQTKESSQAIHAAIPILQSAETVKLLTINKGKQEQQADFDMGSHLANHDINVVMADEIKTKVPIGETLLSRIADTGSDLLIMGAYGHSRAHEYVFGGVTKTMLSSMTVPVLMMH